MGKKGSDSLNVNVGTIMTGSIEIQTDKAAKELFNLQREIKNIMSLMSNMSRGVDVTSYWNEQAASIENVISALKDFKRNTNSVGSAENLVKALNAFSAWNPNTNIASYFDKMGDGAQALIDRAKQLATNLDSAFSVPALREAFNTLEQLKASGADLDQIFSKLRAGDVQGLVEEVDQLQRSLSRANTEIRDLQDELDKVHSGQAFSEMQDKLNQLESGIEMAKEEFRAFLQMNGFHGWDLDEDGQFRDFFQSIADGSRTASQAINDFKQQYSYMFREMSGGDMTAVMTELTRIAEGVAAMRNELTQLGASGSMSEMRTSLQQSADAAREQNTQLQQMSTNASVLEALISALTQLAQASAQTGESAEVAKHAVSQLVDSVTSLGQTDIASLQQLSDILKALARMDGLTVGKASIQNLVGAFEQLSSLPNTHNLTALSAVDLRNFNDLHISKASLNNLATFLPTIASVNVGTLQQLASINWDKLSNMNVSKTAVNNLKELSTMMTGRPLTLEGMKVSFDETSLSTLTKSIEDSIQRASKNIKLTIDNVELSAAARSVIASEVSRAASSGGSGTVGGSRRGSASVDAEKKSLQDLVSLWKEYYDLAAKQAKYVTSGDNRNADLYRELAAAKREEISVLEEAYPKLHEQAMAYEEVQQALVRFNVAMNNMQTKFDAKETQASVDALREYQRQLDSLGISNKNGIKFGGDKAAVEQYTAALNTLRAKLDDIRAANDSNRATAVAAYEEQRVKVEQLRDSLNQAATAAQQQAQANKLANSIDQYLSRNSALSGQLKATLQGWSESLRSGAAVAEGSLGSISQGFANLTTQIKVANVGGKSFFQSLQEGWRKFGGWSIVSRSFMMLIRTMKQAVSAVKEVDAAMVELRKVTQLTEYEYSKFYESAAQTAKSVGASLSDVINATAD